jgi:vacuolar-type H+-ATPase subunit I/STV1
MTPARLETLVWVLIYGGILFFCLGWFMQPSIGAWGEVLMSAGGVGVAAGIVALVLRARR